MESLYSRRATNLNNMEQNRLDRRTADMVKRYTTKIHNYDEERKDLKKKLFDIHTMRTSPAGSPRATNGTVFSFDQMTESGFELSSTKGKLNSPPKLRTPVHATPPDTPPTPRSVRFRIGLNDIFPSPPTSPRYTSPAVHDRFDFVRVSTETAAHKSAQAAQVQSELQGIKETSKTEDDITSNVPSSSSECSHNCCVHNKCSSGLSCVEDGREQCRGIHSCKTKCKDPRCRSCTNETYHMNDKTVLESENGETDTNVVVSPGSPLQLSKPPQKYRKKSPPALKLVGKVLNTKNNDKEETVMPILNGSFDSSSSGSPISSPSDSPLLRRFKAFHIPPIDSPRLGHRSFTYGNKLPTGAEDSASRPESERPKLRRRALTADGTSLQHRAHHGQVTPRLSDLDRQVKEITDRTASNIVHEARAHLRKYENHHHHANKKQISLNYKEHGRMDVKHDNECTPRAGNKGNELHLSPREPRDKLLPILDKNDSPRLHHLHPGQLPLIRYHSSDNLSRVHQHQQRQHEVEEDTNLRPNTDLRPSRLRLRRTSSLEDISTLLLQMKTRENTIDDGDTESVYSVATTTMASPHLKKRRGWATVRSQLKFGEHTEERAARRRPLAKLKKMMDEFLQSGRTADVMAFEKMKVLNSGEHDDSANENKDLEECRYLRKYVPKFARAHSDET